MKKQILTNVAAAIAAVCAVSTAFAAAPKESDGMFVDEHGMTLYTFDKDTAGERLHRRQAMGLRRQARLYLQERHQGGRQGRGQFSQRLRVVKP